MSPLLPITVPGWRDKNNYPADSSEITLGAKSQISSRISDSTRSVDLISGEAFLMLPAIDKNHFLFELITYRSEVVGTQFNVQKIRDVVSVAVLEGVVNVFGQTNKDSLSVSLPDAVLTAGQKVVKASGGPLSL